MKHAKIKPLHATCIIIMYIVGSSVVMGVSTAAKQDAWAAVLIAAACAVLAVLVYARIMKLYPELGLYDILEQVFGKVLGKVVTALYALYALHLGSLVLRNFVEFVSVSMLRHTPPIIVAIVMMCATVYLVKSGVQTLGKMAVTTLLLLLIVVAITVISAIPQMEVDYLKPFLSTEANVLLLDSFSIFAFPYAETVLLLTVAQAFRKQDSPYRTYLFGILAATFILVVIVIRNILILGPEMSSTAYFPSFVSARIINIGDFFARIEGSISMNFIMSGIIKISVCLFAASNGISNLFQVEQKRLVFPVGMIMIALCSIIYASAMEMFEWLKVYRIYAAPVQIILPLAVWITGEIKTRRAARAGAQAG